MNRLVLLLPRGLAWLAVAVWASTLTYFSSLTGSEIAFIGLSFWDKAQHFLAFLAGGVLLGLALRWSVDWPWKKLTRFAIFALVIFGAIDEIHQLFTPFRSGADPADWFADGCGAFAGVRLFAVIHARIFRTTQPAPARN